MVKLHVITSEMRLLKIVFIRSIHFLLVPLFLLLSDLKIRFFTLKITGLLLSNYVSFRVNDPRITRGYCCPFLFKVWNYFISFPNILKLFKLRAPVRTIRNHSFLLPETHRMFHSHYNCVNCLIWNSNRFDNTFDFFH